MRVGVITNRNLRSPWASTHFYMHRALRRLGVDARHVAGKEIADYHACQGGRKNGRRFAGKQQPSPFTPELTQAVKQDIERSRYDALLALHASTVIPSLKIECPLVYVTDATAALLNNYYPTRQELSEQYIEQLQKCEETTIAKSDAVLVPTQWAADSVVQDYGAEPSRVHTIEWGGNLDRMPHSSGELASEELASEKMAVESLASDWPQPSGDRQIRFLFVGLDWHRKGGDIATKMIEVLRASGVEAVMTVVGASIPKQDRSPYVRSLGMLNRANRQESAKLDRLFCSADFYIHPARAECYGHVLCEALGFGVPVIATRTGGISQCVIDGETGVLLRPEASAEEFAQSVQELLADRPALTEMSANAVQDFRKRLNWDRWAPRVQTIMQGLLSPTVQTSSE